MAYDHKAVIESQYEALAAERAQAVGDYESGRLNENAIETMNAANRILEIDAKADALNRIAHGMVAQQQQPQGNKYGLNSEEIDVAKISGISDEEYARNKHRMQTMKAQGYWDQGRVTR